MKLDFIKKIPTGTVLILLGILAFLQLLRALGVF